MTGIIPLLTEGFRARKRGADQYDAFDWLRHRTCGEVDDDFTWSLQPAHTPLDLKHRDHLNSSTLPLLMRVLPSSLIPLLRSSKFWPTQTWKPITAFSTITKIMAKEYKIKGLPSLDLSKGEKREVEVDGIEGGKVLLVNHNGTTHAMSPNCTHYGAPLKLGVLNPEGRLTCAWHGGQSHSNYEAV